MKKIVTIIGARPQIIKAAALSRTIREHYTDKLQEIIVHTGQHYDDNMSGVFFGELNIPQPHHNLQVGSASHGLQTARMIEGIEKILVQEKPDFLVLYGDTNSTLAGAVAASKIHIPVVHIEAGLRSFNKSMPEEINRILCDHASTLLFSPTITGYHNLLREGFIERPEGPWNADRPGIFHCGDVMYDNSLWFASMAEQQSRILENTGLSNRPFILCTLHRNNNTDEAGRLQQITEAWIELATVHDQTLVIPLHPRTRKMMDQLLSKETLEVLHHTPNIHLIEPVGFLDMIRLEQKASLVITDSGGVQKEAYFFQKPGIILRPETEWVEIVEQGAARLADANKTRIMEAFNFFHSTEYQPLFPPLFGDGNAAAFICEQLISC